MSAAEAVVLLPQSPSGRMSFGGSARRMLLLFYEVGLAYCLFRLYQLLPTEEAIKPL